MTRFYFPIPFLLSQNSFCSGCCKTFFRWYGGHALKCFTFLKHVTYEIVPMVLVIFCNDLSCWQGGFSVRV